MPRGALTVGIAALAALLTLVVGCSGPSTPPDSPNAGVPGRLVAQAATISLGSVPFDVRAEARFDLVNTGGDTVRLEGAPRVRTLQGC